MQIEQNKELTKADLVYLYNNLDKLSEAELRSYLKITDSTVVVKEKENCQENFMDFAHKVWPNFIDGEHHAKMAAAFEKVARGEIKRLIINMPPDRKSTRLNSSHT